MPRTKRQRSALGIYHVMLRGINKQNIFFSDEDYRKMMMILRDAPFVYDKKSNKVISSDQCRIYAYCILDNHVHILIQENELTVSDIVGIIATRYALYYNRKYERVGHLFQARFESEPVNDPSYFHILLRYIHRNPVKAMESTTPEEYPYSSWNEYTTHKSNLFHVLQPVSILSVFRRYPKQELIAWVNESVNDVCLDMDTLPYHLSDREAAETLLDICGLDNIEDFRSLDSNTQIFYMLQALSHNVSISQCARLGSITRYQIEKAISRNVGESSETGTVPDYEETLENRGVMSESLKDMVHKRIRTIPGLRTKKYEQLHFIADYLLQHSEVKCSDVAEHLSIVNETARKLLVILSNERIIKVIGKGKNVLYSLQNVGESSETGTVPDYEETLENDEN